MKLIMLLYHCGVRVGFVRIYTTVVNDILEGSGHVTAIATLISILRRAVHQVLRTERKQLTCSLF